MYLQRMKRANGAQARERDLRDVGTQDGLRSWRFFSRIHRDSIGVLGSLPLKMVISWYLLWILDNFWVILGDLYGLGMWTTVFAPHELV